jgi:hypothetical protein
VPEPKGRLGAYLESRLRWAAFPLACSLALTAIVTTLVSFLSGLSGEGHDFYAYLEAARRLSNGANPYLETLLSGAATTTSYGEYLYPPLFAQLLLAIAWLPDTLDRVAFVAYTALSLLALAAGIALGWRFSGGRLTLAGALLGAGAVLAYIPVVAAMGTGNIGPALAAIAAIAIVGHPLLAGMLGGLIKVLPGILWLAVKPRTLRRRETLVVLAIALVSLLLSPEAWRTYLFEALPATMRTDDPIGLGGAPAALARLAGTLADLRDSGGEALLASLRETHDLAIIARVETTPWRVLPVELLRSIALLEVPLRVASLMLAGLLIVAGARVASDPRRPHVAVALLLGGSLLVPWTLWDHYLVVLLPSAFIAWRVGSPFVRRELALGWLLGTGAGWALLGAYLMIPVSMLLLLDGIRRTRLPESAT